MTKVVQKPSLSKKDFRESPDVELFYKTIHDFSLRKEAYKLVLKNYLTVKDPDNILKQMQNPNKN